MRNSLHRYSKYVLGLLVLVVALSLIFWGGEVGFHRPGVVEAKITQEPIVFDKANPQITMRKIEKLGVVSLKREAHPRSHHSRHYWVHFRFDREDPVKVVSLDEGLSKLRWEKNKIESPE